MSEFFNVTNNTYLEMCRNKELIQKIKVEILDHSENVLGEITSKISSTAGSINVKYNQGVRRTCDLTISNYNEDFSPDDEDNQLSINRKFKIWIGLSDGKDTYWFSQGIFISKTFDCNKIEKSVHLSGVDKFGFCTSDTNQHTLQVNLKGSVCLLCPHQSIHTTR